MKKQILSLGGICLLSLLLGVCLIIANKTAVAAEDVDRTYCSSSYFGKIIRLSDFEEKYYTGERFNVAFKVESIVDMGIL